MAYIELPILADTPDQSFSIALDGSVYHLRLRYNSRADYWMLFISTADGTPLLSGMAVRLGADLLDQYADAELPPGGLFAVNFVDAYAEPDRDNFGRDVSLIYQEAE
jgi:hypothetical protein